MTTTIYYAKLKNKNTGTKRPEAMAMLSHLLWIRRFKKYPKVTPLLSGGKMKEEDYLATMEIVKNIQNGKH